MTSPVNSTYTSEYKSPFAKERRPVIVASDVSTKFTANMRLIETTGVGSGIMTEHSNNIYQLFGRDEIVTYKDHDDCLSKIDYYKNNLDELKEIALKGQKRTLKDHSSFVRISTIDSIIKKKL